MRPPLRYNRSGRPPKGIKVMNDRQQRTVRSDREILIRLIPRDKREHVVIVESAVGTLTEVTVRHIPIDEAAPVSQ